MQKHSYWVYIVTNPNKTALYIGVTNNLTLRLEQHLQNKGKKRHLLESTIATIWFIMKSSNTSIKQLLEKAIKKVGKKKEECID